MKYVFVCALFALCITCFAQEATVEKSVTGIQMGFLGVWVHQERQLTNTIALRAEVGLDAGYWGGILWPRSGYLYVPVLTLEPRVYYNLSERSSRSRKTANNSGNFVAVKTSFHPNALIISNYSNVEIISDLTVVPTWGIRRHIGDHIAFETGMGIGYRLLFAKNAGYFENFSEVTANLHFRIGYTF